MSRSGPTPPPHAALVVFLVLGLVACEAPGAIGSPGPPGSPSATVSAGPGGAASDPLDPESWEWRAFGGDPGFSRYAPLDQIDRTNVEQLQVLWRRPAVDPAFLREHPDLNVPRYLLSTPQMIDGVLYVSNGIGLVEAIDPGTGETLWMQEPPGGALNGRSNRGLGYWTDGTHHRLLSVRGDRLYAVDRETGVLDPAFGENGSVSLRRTGPGTLNFSSLSGVVVVGDVVVVTGLRGGAGDRSTVREREPEDVMGYDVRTGRHLWTFHVVPREGEFGSDTWGDEAWAYAGDAGSWCCMSADGELGLVYVPFSSPTGFYGGWRPGDNLFSNSLVAIDARTGERVWHFQAIRHGIWEHELAGAPALGEITVDGRTIRAVMQPSKMGLLFVLDRTTGEPVWPMEERAFLPSTVPGEVTSPTQPIPTRPAPFGRIGVTEDDLIDFTPELRASAVEFLRPYHLEAELYAPPPLVTGEPGGTMGMLTVPGTWGAGNWHTGAFDPETGFYYAQAHVLPGIVAVVPTDDPEQTIGYPRVGESPIMGPEGLPLVTPPYGTVTAIDMGSGEHVWTKANGDAVNRHPLLRELDLPPLGTPSRPSALLTRTLLFLGEGSDVFGGVSFGGRAFQAFDKATGEILWSVELPGGTTSQPMTYMHEGRQYLVVPIGDSGHPAEWVALGLP